jgi:hypothetical protein
MSRAWVAAVAALVVGCGGGKDSGAQPTQSGGGGNGGGGGEVGGTCTGPVAVRLEVTDPGFFVRLELDVQVVDFETNGAVLEPDGIATGALVVRPGEPVRLATVKLPQGAVVDAALILNQVRACLPDHCLTMDPCTSPLTSKIDFWKVRDRCTATVRLDLDRSVYADRERWAFLPRFGLYY